MPEPRGARSLIENAEQAAAAGDYASAEDLLREAVALQEQTLGPNHPDLANTLNNLGVVCEITDNPLDAEHYFRRAYTIATATLAPDHPFVATSRKNLHDFCAARGRPAELPPSPPAVAAWLDAPAHRAAAPRESSPSAEKQEVTPIARKRSMRPLAFGALGGVAVLIVLLVMTWPWDRPAEETALRPATETTPARETAAPKPTLPPAEPIARSQQTAKPTQPTSKRGRCGRRQANHAHETSRDAYGGYGAALHRPQGLAMRGCGQPGSTRADVFLHTGQIRDRHHD